jgi:hypothetical protein
MHNKTIPRVRAAIPAVKSAAAAPSIASWPPPAERQAAFRQIPIDLLDPKGQHEFAGGDHRGTTDDGDGFTLATRLHAQNAKAVVFVMKCYTLDEAG